MKSLLVAFLTVCFILGLLFTSVGAASIRPGTCSYQNKLCTNFCKTSGRGDSCFSDCAGRLNYCKKSGEYVWNSRPNVTGLRRE